MSSRTSFISRLSRKLHLWLGLLFVPLLVLLAFSGIGLNHPKLVQSVSLPLGWMPENYAYSNWNRGLIEAVIPDNLGGYYATGKEGVWHLTPSGSQLLSNDLQQSAWQKMGYSLYLDQTAEQLLGGSRDGLYSFDLRTEQWRQIPGSNGERFVSIVRDDQGLVVASRSGLYRLLYTRGRYQLSKIAITLADNGRNSPLFRFIFQLHSGELWGTIGKLIMDMVGGLLAFLSLTALYLFLFPRLVKRKLLGRKGRVTGGRAFRWLLRHHNKLGLLAALFLLISGLTGMVMRPPGLILISNAESPVKLDDLHGSALPHIIEKAQWDPEHKQLMLLTSGGLYLGSLATGEVFQPAPLPVPVHAMGATLFEPYSGGYLVGSFSGIYHWRPSTGQVSSLSVNTGRAMVMPKAVVQQGAALGIFDFYTGFHLLNGKQLGFPMMPASVNQQASISLWHMLFELHNMRIFQSAIGPFYLLLIALTGLALVLLSVSGVYEYFRRR